MDIVKLVPSVKSNIWGGTKLIEMGKKCDGNILAECWELSFHPDGPCLVGDTPLKDIVSDNDLGKKVKAFPFFPMLIKFIDSKQDLSVQVHPSDEYALKNEGQFGKTEMWYIMDSEPNAGIYLGFKRDVTLEEYKNAIGDGSIMELMNFIKVKKGDHYFIQSGTLHAIGAGITLCEIQQNSNLTYRVYDYNRTDKNGNKRELHIDKALKVTSLKKYEEKQFSGYNGLIGKDKYFTVYENKIDGSKKYLSGEDSFIAVSVVDGEGKIGDKACFKGDTLFVPANYGCFKISGKLTVLISTVE